MPSKQNFPGTEDLSCTWWVGYQPRWDRHVCFGRCSAICPCWFSHHTVLHSVLGSKL